MEIASRSSNDRSRSFDPRAGDPRVDTRRPRFPTDPESRDRLVEAFMAAAFRGNVAALADLLAEDAVCTPTAAASALRHRPRSTAGEHHGVLQRDREGSPPLPGPRADGKTIAFEIAGDRIEGICVVRNPDKLRHLT